MIKVKNHKIILKGEASELAAETLTVLKHLINCIIPEKSPEREKAMMRAIFSTMQEMLKDKCSLDIEIRLDGEVLE